MTVFQIYRPATGMWVSLDSDAACRVALLQALDEYGIVDTATLHVVLEVAAADFARTLCDALRAAPPAASSAETMTDTPVLSVGTHKLS